MKSVLNPEPKPKEEIKYPCLMISDIGRVVLFAHPSNGVKLYDPDGEGIGDYSPTWAMDCFKPYSGEVILSND